MLAKTTELIIWGLVNFRSAWRIHGDRGLRGVKNRLRLFALMLKNKQLLDKFAVHLRESIGDRINEFPVDYIGTVQWPYLSSSWKPWQSLQCIASHYKYLARQCPRLILVGREERIELVRVTHEMIEYSIVLDRPSWFMREGELVLSLFQGELRIVSAAFSFCEESGEPALYIGAIQGLHKGIDSQTSLRLFRDATKHFHGLRPRSLMVDVVRMLARVSGVKRIYAIKDQYRHHRHPYFGTQKNQELGADYDQIWTEHGAIESNFPDFFCLPLLSFRKTPQEIPTQKRAMYRRRFDLLDRIEGAIETVLKQDELLPSPDSLNT